MLRILTLSTLFPNKAQPRLGIFVERQTHELAALHGVELEVVAPVGLPPWPLSRHSHYAARAELPELEQWRGLTVHRPRYPVLPLLGQRFTARSMARSLLPLLRDIRRRFAFDVIDAEFFWPDGPAAAALSGALGVPFSIKARGADINFWGERSGIAPQIAAAAAAAGGLLAVSGALRDKMIVQGMPAARIKVHYTGVDLNRFKPRDRAAAKAELGIAGSLVVTVGALIERKGQKLALEALARIPRASLILVGDGPDRPALEKLARRLGIDSSVRFLGSRPQEEVAGLMAAADVMLLPCRSEGLANVWIEALACGTPVVTSAIPGADEAITTETGRLVPLDPDAIAEAVKALIAKPPSKDMLRKSASRFSWEKNACELRDHLAAIAGVSRAA